MSAPPRTESFSERIVNRLARGPLRPRASRRSFLAGSVLVGSALAVNPWDFITKPVTAYAAVCGPGAACSDGWSVFCCTINDGSNSCPAGSFVGGWWKADQSSFCAGSARYYIDCNAKCGSHFTCHCNKETCDTRLVACNQFRYGQCHQEIECYGPVVCRRISCTPPWHIGEECTSSSATDNRTRSQSAPCLPGTCPQSVIDLYGTYHRTLGVLGYPTSGYEVLPGGKIGYVMTEHGQLRWIDGVGTFALWGIAYLKWVQVAHIVGEPVSSTLNYLRTDKPGTHTKFADGYIVTTPTTGAHAMWGPILTAWGQTGGRYGPLGAPVSDIYPSERKSRCRFEHGTLTYDPATNKVTQGTQ